MKFILIIDKTKDEEVTVTAHSPSELTSRLEALVLEYGSESTLVGYTDGEIVKLCFTDIECLTVFDGKTYAIDSRGTKYKVKKRLCELETTLPSYFIRINKSTIANENRLLKFTTTFSGAVNAVFKCGYVEYVSRRCFADIKRRLDQK